MNYDSIHWCLKCNLATVSRRCPVCRCEASKLKADPHSEIVPMFGNDLSFFRNKTDERYGEGCGHLLLPKESTPFILRSRDRNQIVVNGGIVGKAHPDRASLNVSGLSIISKNLTKNIVRCDHDSSYFVKKGRNLMVTGVTECTPGLKVGDKVVILDDRNTPIASGTMRMNAEDMGSDRGVAVVVRHTERPRFSEDVKGHGWKDTLKLNASTVSSAVGMAAKDLKALHLSYGYPVVIDLTSDISSEAILLIALGAGLKPKAFLKKDDEFSRFLAEKHGLEIIDSYPEKCLLLTEDQHTDVIAHSPIRDWDPAMVWMYVMIKAEPFDPVYLKGFL